MMQEIAPVASGYTAGEVLTFFAAGGVLITAVGAVSLTVLLCVAQFLAPQITGTTLPPAFSCPNRIERVEQMAVAAVSLPRMAGAGTNTAQQVYGVGHRFQMQRVDAGWRSAEMIEFQVARDRADQKFIGPSVGTDQASLIALNERPIPEFVMGGSPDPAWANVWSMPRRVPVRDFGPEAIWLSAALMRAVARTKAAPSAPGAKAGEVDSTTFAESNTLTGSHCRAASRAAGGGEGRHGVDCTVCAPLIVPRIA